MAFDPLQMSLFVGANGNSIWYYKSSVDPMATIIAANYFGPNANVMNVGDMIILHDSANLNDIVFVKTTDNLFALTVAAFGGAPVAADAGEGTKEYLAAEKAKAKAKEAAIKGDTGATDPTRQEPRDETPAEMRRREKLEEEQREKREDEQNHRPPHRR